MNVNLFSTQGATIYNIQEVGGSETGTSTSFIITPNPGFIIFAEQFSATAPQASDIYSSITFENTTNVGSSDNEVLVTLFWDGVTDLTDNNTIDCDYNIDIQLTYDDTIESVSFQTTELSFEFEFGLTDVTGSEQLISPQVSVNWNQAVNSSIAQVSTSIQGINQVELFQYQILVDDIGEKFIGDGIVEATILNENEESQGAITYYWEALQDLFGNKKGYKMYFYYTPVEDVFIDQGAKVLVEIPQLVDYVTNFDLASEVVPEAPALDNHALNFSTNIPNPSNKFNLTFSDTWASSDTSNSENQVFIDVQELSSGSRTLSITLKDNLYNIVRDTFELTQREDFSIELKVNQKLPGEVIVNDTPASYVWSDSGKIISNPNVENLNYFAMNSQTNYDTSFVGDIAYTLKAIVDGAVELSDLNNAALFTLTQSQSFNDDWVKFATDWTDQGNGNWYRDFYIRNNNTNSDRTATFSLTHPDDSNVSDALVITQDAEYLSTTDTVTAKATYSGSSTGFAGYGNELIISNSGVHDVILKIKMADWENDFTLPNASQTDESVGHTFKQYPEARVSFSAAYAGGNVGDNIIVSSFTDIGELIYNAGYNPSASNNDHQYYLNINLSENLNLSTRKLSIRIYHAQNNAPFSSVSDHTFFIEHSGISQVSASIVDDQNETINSNEEQTFIGDGTETKKIRLDWPYSSPLNNPIVGLWNPNASGVNTYSAINPGVETSNGLTITAQQNVVNQGSGGIYSNVFNATFAANTPNNERTEYLAFWLHGSDTNNTPDSFFELKQLSGAYSQELYNVTANVQNSDTPSSISLDSGSGSFVVEMKVSDYTSDDYNNDLNEPIVNMLFQGGLFGGPLGEPGVMTLTGFNITKNSSWLLDNTAHTHEVTISHNANTSDESLQYFFRVKHEYNTTGNYDSIINITKSPAESLFFNGGHYTYNDTTVDYFNELDSANNEDVVTVPSNTNRITVSLNTSVTLDQIDSRLYPNLQNYIYARFLTFDETKIFNEAGTEDVPDMFDANAVNHVNDYRHIIPCDDGNPRVNVQPATINGSPGSIIEVGLPMVINQADGGAQRDTKIGIWTGLEAPVTNLIDTSAYAAKSGTSSNFKTQVFGNVASGISGAATAEACFTPRQDSSGDYTGFDWDPTAVGSSALSGESTTATVGVKLDDQSGNVSLSSGEFGISFDIIEHEQGAYDMVSTVGISSGWYSATGEQEIDPSNGNNLTLINVVNNLRGNTVSTYAGRIKSINVSTDLTNTNSINNTRCIRFFGRSGVKYKARNIKVWKIEDDLKLKPDATISSNDTPMDVLKITQLYSNSSSLSFLYNGLHGSPIGSNIASSLALDSTTSTQANFIGSGIFRLKLQVIDAEGHDPKIRKWNGQTSSSIGGGGIGSTGYFDASNTQDSSAMFNFVSINFDVSVDEVVLSLNPNNDNQPREITLGLYDGVPSSNTQAPLSTFKIIQI